MALEAINGIASIVGVLNSGVTTVDRSLLSNRNNIQIEALKQLEQGFASRVDAALSKLDTADIATPKIKGLQREQAILTGRKARLTSAIEVTTKSLDQIVFIKSALENLNTKLAEVNAGTLSEADFALLWDNTLRIINLNTENASIAYKDGGISRQQNLISSNSRTSFHASSFLAPYNSQGDTFLISGQYVGSDYFLTENGGTRLIPGSHKWPLLDYKTANSAEVQKLAVSLNAPKGTAIVWEGRVWHGNGLNRSGSIRSNISTAFLQPWVKPQEYHQYSIREEVIERLSEKQKHILGFSSFGTLGGHDGSSVSPTDFDPNKESIGILKP